ncbi:MAG: biopolymer transporter ExbD [Deltaproteobacteria bacterium]|nr:biopolymer transporter ExbD [Deltaproteobacteria bacterium]
MAVSIKDDDDIMAGINVTPLVDITLVLLIIFMVTATFMKDPVVPIELPRAATAQEAQVKNFALVLDAKGKLYVNGHPSSLADAAKKLKAAHRADPSVQAIIAADGEVRHKQVIRVIDLVRRCGIVKFAVNVQPEAQP